jgi:predicted nucleic acid-binding protein
MILLDSSVWVDHLRRSNARVVRILDSGQGAIHPFIIGEIACGHLKSRAHVLGLLGALPRSSVATDDEVLHFIEGHRLMGPGLGFVDAHLLAAAAIDGTRLWTLDKRLAKVASEIGLIAATNLI